MSPYGNKSVEGGETFVDRGLSGAIMVFQECIDQSCLVAGCLPVVTDLLYSAIRPDQMDFRGLKCRSLNAVAGGIDNPIGDDRIL